MQSIPEALAVQLAIRTTEAHQLMVSLQNVKRLMTPDIVVYSFNPAVRRQKQVDLHDFKSSLGLTY